MNSKLDQVIKSFEDGMIIGVDFTGVEHLGESDTFRHIWVYENRNRFVPILSYETALTEKEISKIFEKFAGKIWTHDDRYDINNVMIRYYAINEPYGCSWMN